MAKSVKEEAPKTVVNKFITGFCEHGHHVDGEPMKLCPVLIKHDRTAKVWTCSCRCHEGQDIAAMLDAHSPAVSEAHGGAGLSAREDMDAGIQSGKILVSLRAGLQRVLART